MNADAFTPRTAYVTYIATTPEKLWTALTNGEITPRYFFGRRIELEQKSGGLFRFWQEDGTLDVEGRVVECDAPRKLAVTWRVMWMEEYKNLPECLVAYEMDSLGPVVRLMMTESHRWAIGEKLLEGGRRGWPVILSGLKTLLETGQPLPKFAMGK